MTNRVQRLQMIVLSMVIASGLTWNTSRLSGQASPSVALVIDDTGSMIQEMPAARQALTAKIALLQADAQAAGKPFPQTAIITFKDDVTTRLISNDPVQLQAVVDSLVPSGGGDCPESSIEAQIRAGNMLLAGGELTLWTDADSHPNGPPKAELEEILKSKDLHASYIVSNSCVEPFSAAAGAGEGSALDSGSANHDPAWQDGPARDSHAWTAAALGMGSVLGIESSVNTFSALASETGGTFVAIPKSSLNTADGRTRYINVSANLIFTTVLPAVTLVTPAAVPQDGTVAVELTGGHTNFQGSSTVSVGGTGVSVLSQTVVSPTRMLVNLVVSASAAPGFRDVTVATNLGGGILETARGVGALQVTTPPAAATIVGISPSQIAQGATTNVTITGAGSHFVNGASTLLLGAGVTVNSVNVSSPTSLTANVTVGLGSAIGFRDVSVTTGTEIAAEAVVGPLLIIAAPAVIPRIVMATPASGSRGKQLSVTLTGENTNFNATTTVGFSGVGISVQSVAVTSATSLTAVISIASDAILGFRTIVVTTASEVAVLLDGFNTLGGTTHDLIVDFGPRSGLLLWDGRTGQWTPFHPSSPKSIVTGDLDGNGIDEVILDFGPEFGIWIRANDSIWYQIHSSTANHMVTGDLDGNGQAELLVDFPDAGIWVWANSTSWYQLDATNSSLMVTGDLDGNGKAEAIIDFPTYGIWVWVNNTSWFSLDSGSARSIVVDDFSGNGRDEVVADFDGYGIWRYALGSSWSPVLPLNASRLAAGDVDGNGQSDLIVDVGNPHGIWILLNGGAWSQLHARTSRQLLTSDLDNNGKADIIFGFGAQGLWEYANNETLIQLHTLNPRAIAAGHIKAP